MDKRKNIQTKDLPISELISKIKLAFANAKLPEILPQLQTLGYTEEKLNTYLQKVADLEQLMQNQKKEYAEQYAETEKFNQKKTGNRRTLPKTHRLL
ncbi:hypothetical protein QIU18_06730 [Capnocytophaga canimorsus]|nr:hypothetical protein [Capnocytophaga canimorsus]WGU69404.1 hypothetical protein QIU19_07005 [Capnocytophaga canimorsus]WGU71473.1 hypothetical protein QIU18_06730 [Capnocytophaga canimorsus]